MHFTHPSSCLRVFFRDSQISDCSPIEFYLILFNSVLHGSRDFLGLRVSEMGCECFVWGQLGSGIVMGAVGPDRVRQVGGRHPPYYLLYHLV